MVKLKLHKQYKNRTHGHLVTIIHIENDRTGTVYVTFRSDTTGQALELTGDQFKNEYQHTGV